jgi:hypothetical protein
MAPLPRVSPETAAPGAYFDSGERDDVLAGGVKLIPIRTPKGMFRVWTKRVGNNPTVTVLLLRGGPGATHEYFEAFDSYFPRAVRKGRYLYCPNGSHLALYDDQKIYMAGVIKFVRDVDSGHF